MVKAITGIASETAKAIAHAAQPRRTREASKAAKSGNTTIMAGRWAVILR